MALTGVWMAAATQSAAIDTALGEIVKPATSAAGGGDCNGSNDIIASDYEKFMGGITDVIGGIVSSWGFDSASMKITTGTSTHDSYLDNYPPNGVTVTWDGVDYVATVTVSEQNGFAGTLSGHATFETITDPPLDMVMSGTSSVTNMGVSVAGPETASGIVTLSEIILSSSFSERTFYFVFTDVTVGVTYDGTSYQCALSASHKQPTVENDAWTDIGTLIFDQSDIACRPI